MKAMTRKYTPNPAASERGRRPFAIHFPLVPAERIYLIPSFLFLIIKTSRPGEVPKVFPVSVRPVCGGGRFPSAAPFGGTLHEIVPDAGGSLRDARGAVPRDRGARGVALPGSRIAGGREPARMEPLGVPRLHDRRVPLPPDDRSHRGDAYATSARGTRALPRVRAMAR